ncbi:TetR/AcrR family transcriptional regulator [Propionivibrio soli]|uniref:TetR/AcrR family transcriptional regulator n=1 Tax=Propionivibrio soli TaxID=2976531 RepID=UPI0021E6FC53|nr:TetR/AcrR family transcriptional regulator [Propionivibrio soli]
MRTKSDVKRQAILDIAAQVFQEHGFERTSMSEISARVGGSKATLYSYFPSKEELFFEALHRSTEVEFEATHRALAESAVAAGTAGTDKFDATHKALSLSDDLGAVLREFGERFIALLYSEKLLAARRLIICESERSQLGRICYMRGPQRSQAQVAEFLSSAMQQGKLRQADPKIAALHLRGLLESELLDRFLFQIDITVSKAEIKRVVANAVDAFMAAYGPLPGHS